MAQRTIPRTLQPDRATSSWFTRAALAAAAGVAAGSPAFAAPLVASWLAPVSGDWSSAANWSTPQAPNNGTPSGASYHAVIAAAGAVYGASVTSNVVVDRVTVDGADSRLFLLSGSLRAVEGVDLLGGEMRLFGGSVVGTTIRSSGGVLSKGSGTGALNAVSLDADLRLDPGVVLSVQNGLTIAGGRRIRLLGDAVSFTELRFGGVSQSLGGGGEVTLDGPPGSADRVGVTLGGMSPGSEWILGESALIRSGTSGGLVGSSHRTLINRGAVMASNGQRVVVQGLDWRNEGLLRAEDGGSIEIKGSMTGGFGTIELGGGELLLSGTFDNAGHVVELGGESPIRLRLHNNGEFVGGTVVIDDSGEAERAESALPAFYLSSKDDGTLRDLACIGTSTSTFRGGERGDGLRDVAIDPVAAISITGSGDPTLEVRDGVVLGDVTLLLASEGLSPGLSFQGTQTISSAQGLGGDASPPRATILSDGTLPQSVAFIGGTTTIGEGIAFLTGGQGMSLQIAGASGLVNRGVVSARTPGTTITIRDLSSGVFENAPEGALEAAGGALVVQSDSWTNAGLVHAQRGALRLIGSALVRNEGRYRMGAAGVIDVDGGLELAPGAALEVAVLHDGVRSTAGVLQVDGLASLAGELEVRLESGTEPVWGDRWAVIGFASRVGDFDRVLLPGAAAPLRWYAAPDATEYLVGVSHTADIDHDGRIGFSDLNVVLSGFNRHGDWAHGDVDGDGFVGFSDLNFVVSQFQLEAPGR